MQDAHGPLESKRRLASRTLCRSSAVSSYASDQRSATPSPREVGYPCFEGEAKPVSCFEASSRFIQRRRCCVAVQGCFLVRVHDSRAGQVAASFALDWMPPSSSPMSHAGVPCFSPAFMKAHPSQVLPLVSRERRNGSSQHSLNTPIVAPRIHSIMPC